VNQCVQVVWIIRFICYHRLTHTRFSPSLPPTKEVATGSGSERSSRVFRATLGFDFNVGGMFLWESECAIISIFSGENISTTKKGNLAFQFLKKRIHKGGFFGAPRHRIWNVNNNNISNLSMIYEKRRWSLSELWRVHCRRKSVNIAGGMVGRGWENPVSANLW